MSKIFENFGISEMPWVIRVYLLLFFSVIALLILPGLTFFSFSQEIMTEIIGIAKESLKIIIAAIIGAVSTVVERKWGSPSK